MGKDNRANRYSPETRARAVRMVFDNQGSYESQAAAIKAIAPKIGCGRDTLRRWVQQEEADTGQRDGVTSEERARIKELEREVRELRQPHCRLVGIAITADPVRARCPGTGSLGAATGW